MKDLMTPILLWLQQANVRQKWAIRFLCALALMGLMYVCVLAPYFRHYLSLKRELGAHQGLLNNKVLRTKTIKALEGANQEYLHILNGIDGHFFESVEADLLVKTLPAKIEQFNNKILVLKPAAKSEPLTRSLSIKKYILSLSLSTQERLLGLVTQSEADLDRDVDLERYYNAASRMVPEGKREALHDLYIKPVGDRLDAMKINNVAVELVMQGDYMGFVRFLDWIYANPKRMDISQLKLKTIEGSPGVIESSFILSLYMVRE